MDGDGGVAVEAGGEDSVELSCELTSPLGKELLDNSIAKCNLVQSVELRFLRLTIQTNLPGTRNEQPTSGNENGNNNPADQPSVSIHYFQEVY